MNQLLSPLLLRTSWRYLLRHPWQIGLCVLGVALGVAVVISIDLANASASRAFSLSTESVTGRATDQIIGGPSGLDEDLYRRLRVELGVRNAAPVVESYVSAPALDGLTVRVFGIDPFAEAPFRSYLSESNDLITSDVDLGPLLTEPGTTLIAEQTARRYGLTLGDTLTVQVGSGQRDLTIVGLLRPNDDLSARALESLLITDISTAQETLGMVGKLSHIDLILPEDQTARASISDTINAVLPLGAELVRSSAQSNALDQMTRAFELNLTALSLLALIVGMFLIYNTMTFSIVQRRTLLGTLRCVGVSRRQIFALIAIEATLISLVGSALGIVLGIVLGRGLVGLVTQTINDLYFVVTVRGLSIDPLVLLKGLLLGVGATLLAAAVPAIEATLTPPRTVLRRSSAEDQVRGLVPRLALVGLGLFGLGGLLLVLPRLGLFTEQSSGALVLAFAALFAIVIGFALLTPALTIALMQVAHPVLGCVFGLLGRMAARDVVAALSRTSVAIAALMVAVSVTIGVGVMVDSFRQTVVAWLNQTLVADIYVSPPTNTANRVDTTLDPALIDEFSSQPGVVDYNFFRNVQVNTPAGPTSLVATRTTSKRDQAGLRFKAGGDDETWQAFANGAVLISEPFAFRSGLNIGDILTLQTDRGMQVFPIAGVYYDYTSDRGVIRVAYNTYSTWWDDPAISAFALYVAPGTDTDALVQRLRSSVAGRAELVISSNQALREGTLVIFDRTFAITAVLQLLATVVAFIGILSALMALQLERARELGMLRANGLTPQQLWGVVFSQTSLMGLTAGLLAIPLGLVLALVLVFVINRRSFGWTLDLTLDPWLFGQALLVAVVAAVLAGVYPAIKMGQTSPALALREE